MAVFINHLGVGGMVFIKHFGLFVTRVWPFLGRKYVKQTGFWKFAYLCVSFWQIFFTSLEMSIFVCRMSRVVNISEHLDLYYHKFIPCLAHVLHLAYENEQLINRVIYLCCRFASDSTLVRYAKIAMQLKDKTVRDVALRCRWMTVSSIF